MTTRKIALVLLAAVTMAAAGCSGDIARQVVSNEQLRGQVMDAIATHRTVALQALDRIMATDSLRVVAVDHLLLNKEVAQQVLVRIGTNPAAFDLVMEVAVRDTAMRQHVLTLLKGVQLATTK